MITNQAYIDGKGGTKLKAAKRVNIVSIKLCKESSVLYEPRYINNPRDAVDLVQEDLANCDREKIIAICLDTKHQPTAVTTISMGTINSSLVHPREVFKTAILSNSAAIILAHNHPSGKPEPSNDDINITKRLVDAGTVLGIDVIDHVIIGAANGQYKSMRELGLI